MARKKTTSRKAAPTRSVRAVQPKKRARRAKSRRAKVAPYGTWKSPLTSDVIVAGVVGLEQVVLDGEDIYWMEGRPAEGGRNVIVRRTPDGTVSDVAPPPFNARTRVHEYGGGAYTVADGTIYASNFADQRLYRWRPGEDPQPLTPAGSRRYADAIIDRNRGLVICVSEEHFESSVDNFLLAVRLDGRDGGHGTVLTRGNDFYSSPRLSPDGKHLAWLTWNHPNMPWDGCELWVGELDAEGRITTFQKIAGGEEESVFQPEWSPDGVLHFVSDESGWWNLHRWRGGTIEALCPMEAEFGRPQWLFGMPTYGFLEACRLVCAHTAHGLWSISMLATAPTDLNRFQSSQRTPIETPFTDIGTVRCGNGKVVFVAGAATEPTAIVRIDLAKPRYEQRTSPVAPRRYHVVRAEIDVLRRSSTLDMDPGYLTVPEPITFRTAGGRTAHAFYYPPRNRDFRGSTRERPPLLVCSHGGPTSATSSRMRLEYQYWTSRGFAVLDVNYGGSTGYGRAYRERLNGRWGIVDMEDCVKGASALVARRRADPRRLAIRGGSAGGYTTLCALTFCDRFGAGASYYGVSDLEALAKETHKFESRYLDRLIGPYPARRDLYIERSPIHFTDKLSCPVILFQGLEDKVVLPNQAEMMVDALRAKKLPVAYVPFEGEQHGFRRAENIKRALDGEFYFYSRIFDFKPADRLEPVVIENL